MGQKIDYSFNITLNISNATDVFIFLGDLSKKLIASLADLVESEVTLNLLSKGFS